MMTADNRLRELLQEFSAPPEPAETQIEAARHQLRQSFRAAEPVAARRSWRRPAVVWGAAIAAVVVATSVLVLPGSTPSVAANLAHIARSARELTAAQLPAGSYVYTHSEETTIRELAVDDKLVGFYLLPQKLDTWTQGASEQVRSAIGTPVFFDEDTEKAYSAAGQSVADGVGTTRTERLGDIAERIDISLWPSDRAALLSQIESEISQDFSPGAIVDERTVDLLLQLMDPTLNAPPGLRASLVEVFGSLDVTAEKLGDDAVRVTIEYTKSGVGVVSHELDIDDAGYLRASRVYLLRPDPGFPVPAGSLIEESNWSRPAAVDNVGIFP